nr:PREDICTED: copine-8-like [Bemisia tabaci]
MAYFVPGSASEPTSEVELTLSCRNLLDCDVFSKSDPMCVVYLKTPEMSHWQEICRTETVRNTLNPDFVKKVHILYRFEVQQNLKFEVYDIDANSSNLDDHDFLGSCLTTLGQVVSSGKSCLPLSGTNQRNSGELLIRVEELSNCNDEITLKFSGRNLDKKDFFGSSDPFFELLKVVEDGTYTLIYRSEFIKWNLNPNWKQFTLPIRNLCGGDHDRDIKISCYDWNRSGNHSLIGHAHITVNQLKAKNVAADHSFALIHPDKARKSSYKNSGLMVLEFFDFRKVYSFLDYIIGGLQIHCTFAIDFTASNGDPSMPQSLHYISDGANQYEQALSAVGEIIQDYDCAKQFPVLGFGARLPPDGRISHEFYVNLSQNNPYCDGLKGVVDSYRSCIRQVQLYGPTNFSPVINHVAKFAAAYQDGSQYFILLIITDGIITDMEHTKGAIVHASTLPMSIIIVGVGQANFAAMSELDADTVPLVYNNVKAFRDIVQFVPFSDFQNVKNPLLAKTYLAKEVLAEIPEQIVSFMKSKNIVPSVKGAPPPYSA